MQVENQVLYERNHGCPSYLAKEILELKKPRHSQEDDKELDNDEIQIGGK